MALVTGAAKRVGRAIALELAAAGWRVAVHHHRSVEAAAEVASEIAASNGEAMTFACDLEDRAEVAALLPRVARGLGPIGLLVNNASLFVYDDVAGLDDALWQRHAAINLTAPVFLARAMAAALPDGVAGSVVNIIDQRVLKPTPLYFSYAVSKAGLWAATEMLAQSLAPRVRVNAIGPGPVLRSTHQSDEQFAAQCRATLLQRGSSPEEVVAAVRFLHASPSMTGQLLTLDGGQHLAWRTPDVVDAEGYPAGLARAGAAASPAAAAIAVDPPRLSSMSTRSVFIDRLEVKTIIGIHPFEKQTPQRVVVSVEMTVLETGSPGSDRFDEVVDYERIVNEVRATVLAGQVNLIETLAERIAVVCLVDRRVRCARITVEKPDIFADCAGVGVTIERRQPID